MPCYHTQLGNILVSGEDTLFGLESEGGGEVSRDSVAQVWGGVDHGGGGGGGQRVSLDRSTGPALCMAPLLT